MNFGSGVGTATTNEAELFVEGINDARLPATAYGVKGTTVTLSCQISKKETVSVGW